MKEYGACLRGLCWVGFSPSISCFRVEDSDGVGGFKFTTLRVREPQRRRLGALGCESKDKCKAFPFNLCKHFCGLRVWQVWFPEGRCVFVLLRPLR